MRKTMIGRPFYKLGALLVLLMAGFLFLPSCMLFQDVAPPADVSGDPLGLSVAEDVFAGSSRGLTGATDAVADLSSWLSMNGIRLVQRSEWAKNDKTTVYFQWGTTTAYGKKTPSRKIVTGTDSNVPVTEALTGLRPGTTYQYRVVAIDSIGRTKYGPNQTATTASTATTVRLNGSINPSGLPYRAPASVDYKPVVGVVVHHTVSSNLVEDLGGGRQPVAARCRHGGVVL
jgi:hypothetical protein